MYGNSLILAGVQASLRLCPRLEIIPLDEPQAILQARLAEKFRLLRPAAVIFDLEAGRLDFPLFLLQQPGLLLVGISSDKNQAWIWSGRQMRGLSLQELVQTIITNLPDSNPIL